MAFSRRSLRSLLENAVVCKSRSRAGELDGGAEEGAPGARAVRAPAEVRGERGEAGVAAAHARHPAGA